MTHDGFHRSSSEARLSSRVGRLVIEPPLMNASGPLSTYDHELWPLAHSRVGAVVMKSTTFAPRGGNAQPRLFTDPRTGTSINANGLCNLGFEAHADQAARLKAETGKVVVASVAALELAQFAPMARRLGAVVDALEINLSCPNVGGKPQVAFDLEASARVLNDVRAATDCDLWVKLPPYQDRRLVEAMAEVLAAAGVQAAVCVNSPSGLDVDVETETTRIHPNDGMGGVGGRDILRIARWSVRQFWLALHARGVDVVGVGGITTGEDAFSHVLCGAAAVQLGTTYLLEGPSVFARVEAELAAVLARHGTHVLREKIGALRVLPASGQTEVLPAVSTQATPSATAAPSAITLGRTLHEDALTTSHKPDAQPASGCVSETPYNERLRARVRQAGAVCFGLDPEPERMPHRDVADYYLRILGRMHARDALPAVVKPNVAYYERLGEAGSLALRRVLEGCRALGLLVLLDGKRGDIDRSASAYADALFAGYGADAVTVSPYMGGDSLAPFTAWCARGRGVYVLCRTSNPGAADLQDLMVGDAPLYERVVERVAGAWWRAGIGAVVGATGPAELGRVAERITASGREVPLLVPGVGAQGGSAREVWARLGEANYDRSLLLVNASSSIAFAGEAAGTHDFAEAAADALLRLRDALR